MGDFTLLRKSNSMLAVILMTALFSIAGLPLMISFVAKLNVFLIAVEKTMYFLVLFQLFFICVLL